MPGDAPVEEAARDIPPTTLSVIRRLFCKLGHPPTTLQPLNSRRVLVGFKRRRPRVDLEHHRWVNKRLQLMWMSVRATSVIVLIVVCRNHFCWWCCFSGSRCLALFSELAVAMQMTASVRYSLCRCCASAPTQCLAITLRVFVHGEVFNLDIKTTPNTNTQTRAHTHTPRTLDTHRNTQCTQLVAHATHIQHTTPCVHNHNNALQTTTVIINTRPVKTTFHHTHT